jgi:hypothetical protein
MRLWFARRIDRAAFLFVHGLPRSPCFNLSVCAQTALAERLTVMRWFVMGGHHDFTTPFWLYRNTREIAWAFARHPSATASAMYSRTSDEDAFCAGSTRLALTRACAARARSVAELRKMRWYVYDAASLRFFGKRLSVAAFEAARTERNAASVTAPGPPRAATIHGRRTVQPPAGALAARGDRPIRAAALVRAPDRAPVVLLS